MATVFMTGATGFIGKEIISQLVQRGHKVLALIRARATQSADGRLDSLRQALRLPAEAPVHAVEGDLSRPGLGLTPEGRELVLGSDVILHAGSPMDLSLSKDEAALHILDGTANLLALAVEIHRTRGLRQFIHVVGYMTPFHQGNVDMGANVRTMNRFMPDAAPYERVKFLADLLVRQSARREGLPLTVINPATVIGSRRTGVTEQLGGFGILVDAIRRGRMPVIPGGEGFWLSLIAVDDLAAFVAATVGRPESAGQTYFAIDDETPRMPEMLRLVTQALGVNSPRTALPIPWLRRFLRMGGSALSGVSPFALDFITERAFPVESFRQAQAALGLDEGRVRDALPSVIADIDYRLSRRGRHSGDAAVMQPLRLGGLAALTQEGTGTPWVVLHGLFSTGEDLVPLARALGGEPVWLLDLAGFGRSPVHGSPEVLEGHVQCVLEGLTEMSGPVRLVGHSFGALVAARVAAQRPALVERLVLLQPPLERPRLPALTGALLRFPRATRFLLRRGLARFAGLPPRQRERALADLRSPRVAGASADALAMLAAGPPGIDLAALSGVPVHLVWGMRDPANPIRWGEEAAARHGHVSLHRVEHGHHFPLTHPLETAALLRELATFRLDLEAVGNPGRMAGEAQLLVDGQHPPVVRLVPCLDQPVVYLPDDVRPESDPFADCAAEWQDLIDNEDLSDI